jgi:hypothetical protein
MAAATQALLDLHRVKSQITTHAPGKKLALTEYGIFPRDSFNFDDPLDIDEKGAEYSNLAKALYDADLLMGLINQFDPKDIAAATAWNLYSNMVESAYIYWNGTIRPQYYALEMLRKLQPAVWLQTTIPNQNSTFTFKIEKKVGNVRPYTDPEGVPPVDCLAAVASRNSNNDRLTLVVINRDLDRSITATIQLPSGSSGFTPSSAAGVQKKTELAYEANGGDLKNAHNETPGDNERVKSLETYFTWTAEKVYTFPKHSLTLFEFTK